MRELSLSNPFRDLWQGKDPFVEIDTLTGEVFRQVKSRRTIRFHTDGKSYFAKIHKGVGWYEIFKEFAQLKRPVLSAHNEWRALDLLRRIGVDTMTPVAYGRKGMNPARLESFIITEELVQTQGLDEYCANWRDHPGPFRLRKALIERVASIARQMHEHGMNHRDCYVCHFLLDVSDRDGLLNGDVPRLHVIDLHRAQVRWRTPTRWVVKDLAGLYFSAMDLGLTRSDCLRFIQTYERVPWRNIPWYHWFFWWRVRRAGRALYRKERRK